MLLSMDASSSIIFVCPRTGMSLSVLSDGDSSRSQGAGVRSHGTGLPSRIGLRARSRPDPQASLTSEQMRGVGNSAACTDGRRHKSGFGKLRIGSAGVASGFSVQFNAVGALRRQRYSNRNDLLLLHAQSALFKHCLVERSGAFSSSFFSMTIGGSRKLVQRCLTQVQRRQRVRVSRWMRSTGSSRIRQAGASACNWRRTSTCRRAKCS